MGGFLMAPFRFLAMTLFIASLGQSNSQLSAAEDPGLYVRRLNQTGNSDIAIEFLSRRLQKAEITDTERSEIELAIAESYLASVSQFDQVQPRDDRLQLARLKYQQWIDKYASAPLLQISEARFQQAEIDLQRGRLHVVLAQHPANLADAECLAKLARDLFSKSEPVFTTEAKALRQEHNKLPMFIPEDERELHERQSKLFSRYIAARFEAALAKFYRADSFRSIAYPPPTGQCNAVRLAQFHKDELERSVSFLKGIDEAQAAFQSIFDEHRRELIGLYSMLWIARCHGLKGDHRRAIGLFDQMGISERLLRFERWVAYFRFISFMQQSEYGPVIASADEWLRYNATFAAEESYQGMQFELAVAFSRIAQAPATATDVKIRSQQRAIELFTLLEKKYNPFQGLAASERIELTDRIAVVPPASIEINCPRGCRRRYRCIPINR